MNKRTLIPSFFLLTMSVSFAFIACSNPLQTKSGAAPGSITGTALLSGQTDNSGILVYAEVVEGARSLSVQRLLAGQAPQGAKAIAAQTSTNNAGLYTLAGLAPGSYVVTASNKDSLEKAVSTLVQVVSGRTVETVVLSLTMPGQIAGKAFLSDAGALPNGSLGIVVFIAGTSYSALTAADGSYAISAVPPGKNYTLVASKAGYDSAITSVNVAVLQTTTVAALTLNPYVKPAATGSVSGSVQLVGGGALQGSFVYLTGSSSVAVTDTSGAFAIAGVAPGSYTLIANREGYASASTPVSVTAGATSYAGTLSLSALPAAEVSVPIFVPGTGVFDKDLLVTISDATPGSSIYYSLAVGGAIPSDPSTASTPYLSPIPVAGNGTVTTIKAVAAKAGLTTSAVVQGGYTIIYGSSQGTGTMVKLPNPQFSLPSGSYLEPQEVSVITTTGGASIRYTLDGSAPTNLYGSLYSGPIHVGPIGTSGQLRAIAYEAGFLDADVISADYSIAKAAVSTFAGYAGAYGSADGQGGNARFTGLTGIASDGSCLYVTDGNAIRKIEISTGLVSTLAGSVGSIGAVDGYGSAARFGVPYAVCTYGGSVFVGDFLNNTIRRISLASGEVTTIAGLAGVGGSIDGRGSGARFNGPCGIATDGLNLYIADYNNATIRRMTLNAGDVSTIAGTAGQRGSADGTGATARFKGPAGITINGRYLYVVDGDSFTVRKIDISTGAVSTIAGTAGAAGSADGTGAAARFNYPFGIYTDGSNLFVADQFNNAIRKIVISSAEVTTIAGSLASGSADGAGDNARFNTPAGAVAVGSELFVTDTMNYSIRKLR